MGKYFTINELSLSQVAAARGIDNTPPLEIIDSLEILICSLLDPIREQWGSPILVNSGYRSLRLNRAVGGVATSQHVKGQAADITTGSPQRNRALFEMIVSAGYPFDQLIDERNYAWIHISYSQVEPRNQILHL